MVIPDERDVFELDADDILVLGRERILDDESSSCCCCCCCSWYWCGSLLEMLLDFISVLAADVDVVDADACSVFDAVVIVGGGEV